MESMNSRAIVLVDSQEQNVKQTKMNVILILVETAVHVSSKMMASAAVVPLAIVVTNDGCCDSDDDERVR
jgi:hypothetical protein